MTKRVFTTCQDAQAALAWPSAMGIPRDPRPEAVEGECRGRDFAMIERRNTGLTRPNSRFHDSEETSPGNLKLRDLHAAMDRAVLDAYGWKDIPTACEFLLDYEEDEEDAAATDTGKGRKKRKPYRYRWPDAVRDEVLARLLALNAKRAEEERISGATAGSKPAAKRVGKRTSKQTKAESETGGLF